MAAYDTWLLVLVAPVLWWLVAMARAVIDMRARAEWDPSVDAGRSYH